MVQLYIIILFGILVDKIINLCDLLNHCVFLNMGIGDWGLGIGDWAQSPIPNPQFNPNNKNYFN